MNTFYLLRNYSDFNTKHREIFNHFNFGACWFAISTGQHSREGRCPTRSIFYFGQHCFLYCRLHGELRRTGGLVKQSGVRALST